MLARCAAAWSIGQSWCPPTGGVAPPRTAGAIGSFRKDESPGALYGLDRSMFVRLMARLVALAVTIRTVAAIMPGIHFSSGFVWLLWVTLIFSFGNLLLGPLSTLTRPAVDRLDAGLAPVGHQRGIACDHGGAVLAPGHRRLQPAGRDAVAVAIPPVTPRNRMALGRRELSGPHSPRVMRAARSCQVDLRFLRDGQDPSDMP